MVKRIVKTESAPLPVGPYSQGVKIGNLFFVSGQGPIDPETGKIVSGGIIEQTKQTLTNVLNILKAGNLGLDNIVKVGVFLRNIEDFTAMNEVYKEYFKSNPPARTTVQAQPPGNIQIEIDAIAYVNENR